MSDSVRPQRPGSPSLGFSRQEHWSGLPFPSPMHEFTKQQKETLKDKTPVQSHMTSPVTGVKVTSRPFSLLYHLFSHLVKGSLKIEIESGFFLYKMLWFLKQWIERLACVHAKLLQLYLTPCDPMDCSPPGSSIHGILQARILEWVAMPSSRGSSWPRDQTHISYTGRRVLY